MLYFSSMFLIILLIVSLFWTLLVFGYLLNWLRTLPFLVLAKRRDLVLQVDARPRRITFTNILALRLRLFCWTIYCVIKCSLLLWFFKYFYCSFCIYSRAAPVLALLAVSQHDRIELNYFYIDFWTFLKINISLEGTFSIREIVWLFLCIIRISRSNSCNTSSTSSGSIAEILQDTWLIFVLLLLCWLYNWLL
jgi:hypothetical protein